MMISYRLLSGDSLSVFSMDGTYSAISFRELPALGLLCCRRQNNPPWGAGAS